MSDDPVLRLETELVLLLRRARAASAAVARAVHPELDAPAYLLLATVARVPGARASDLAETLGVGRGTMSRQLARLEHLGLVVRTPDPHDSRNHPLGLTDTGRELFARAQEGRRDYLREALDGWDPSELDLLADLLGRLNADLVPQPREP